MFLLERFNVFSDSLMENLKIKLLVKSTHNKNIIGNYYIMNNPKNVI